MFRGNTQAFNAVAQDGYDPAAAEAAQRRLKDHQDIDKQQGHQRQLSGKAEASGELSTAPGAARRIADDMARDEEKERRKRIDDVVMLSSLADMEADLAARYGENFADNLFADLFEEGLIEEDEYQQIMAIQDVEERRRAIAAAIQEGINEGRINPEHLEEHEWAQRWLSEHRAEADRRDLQAERGLSGEIGVDDMDVSAQDEADLRSGGSRTRLAGTAAEQEQGNASDRAGALTLGGTGMGGV